MNSNALTLVRAYVLPVLVLVGLFSLQTAHGDDCLKRIFNRYCLGGPAADTLTNAVLISETPTQRVYRVNDTAKSVHVTLTAGTISAVSRRETPGGWLNFTDWKTKLVRRYGVLEDLSEFPDYATSRSSRLNTINSGKGFAHVRWPQQGWSVSLLWNHRDYILLRYDVDGLPSNARSDEEL